MEAQGSRSVRREGWLSGSGDVLTGREGREGDGVHSPAVLNGIPLTTWCATATTPPSTPRSKQSLCDFSNLSMLI